MGIKKKKLENYLILFIDKARTLTYLSRTPDYKGSTPGRYRITLGDGG